MLDNQKLGAVHFTGDLSDFQVISQRIGTNPITEYSSFPRIVGQTGGKGFHFIHPTANPSNALNQTIRAAFEYQGQKYSSCSRLYVPSSWWISEGVEQPFKVCLDKAVESLNAVDPCSRALQTDMLGPVKQVNRVYSSNSQ